MFRKSAIAGLASLAASALLRSRNGSRRAGNQIAPVEKQLHQYTLYVAAPAWIAAGLLDYLWHRKTRIETTTGPEESWLHLLMLIEAGPIALAAAAV
jgi:hypothetical protein